jgi:uncharacterized cupin superfamily protein
MADRGPRPITIAHEVAALTFSADRTPQWSPPESFARLADYRDGAVFVGHWAGRSEWERHPVGDEIVMVLAGETTITFLTDAGEESSRLAAGELVVVPQGTWHRFHTPEGVQVLSVTPQPTDHATDPH